jgi:hypothetical protein
MRALAVTAIGTGLIVAGIALVSTPAAMVVAGLIAVIVGVFVLEAE